MFFWGNKHELLREAKKEASMAQKTWDTVCNLNEKLLGHIDSETALLEEVKTAVTSCPEASHIMAQNGILKKQGVQLETQGETLKTQGVELVKQGKTQMKVLGMLTLSALLLSFLLYAIFTMNNRGIIKAEAVLVEEQVELKEGN